jgi:hypothetical protein
VSVQDVILPGAAAKNKPEPTRIGASHQIPPPSKSTLFTGASLGENQARRRTNPISAVETARIARINCIIIAQVAATEPPFSRVGDFPRRCAPVLFPESRPLTPYYESHNLPTVGSSCCPPDPLTPEFIHAS